jgi:predicted unusual protein kinase regulating ubiquinone biosynthesis (AarF/ABC1/UbiB family)
VLLAEDVSSAQEREKRVLAAVRRANTAHYCPKDDMVAVKVQYADALSVFMQDLKNLRSLAGILSKSEINFDLVSAVDELSSQVKLEFNFRRCGSWLSLLLLLA